MGLIAVVLPTLQEDVMNSIEWMIASAVVAMTLLVVGDSMREQDWGVWMVGAGILQFLIIIVYAINRQLT